jgi:hypothetical protein
MDIRNVGIFLQHYTTSKPNFFQLRAAYSKVTHSEHCSQFFNNAVSSEVVMNRKMRVNLKRGIYRRSFKELELRKSLGGILMRRGRIRDRWTFESGNR